MFVQGLGNWGGKQLWWALKVGVESRNPGLKFLVNLKTVPSFPLAHSGPELFQIFPDLYIRNAVNLVIKWKTYKITDIKNFDNLFLSAEK